MQLEIVTRTRTAEAEISEVLCDGEIIGSIFLVYSPDALKGFSQVNKELLSQLLRQDEPENSLDQDSIDELSEEFFVPIEDFNPEFEDFITNYIRNQAVAADKKVIQVKHCLGTWKENEQLEIRDDSRELPEVTENILNRFQEEAEVHDVEIDKTSQNLKLGHLVYNFGEETHKVGRVIIDSRGTSNHVRIDFWVRPTREITYHAATLLTTLRGRVAGGRFDYYYNGERLRSAMIPTP
jgi:uncharacterized Zn ribbon protein